MQQCDYLVVGSGLTGAVVARRLFDADRDVVVIDRRSHSGGNVHDYVYDQTGIRVHTYGPHYFRTSSDRIWDFVQRFSEFYHYSPSIFSMIGEDLQHWPVHSDYNDRWGSPLQKPGVDPLSREPRPANLEEAALRLMSKRTYQDFVKEYNEKQWGMPATELSADLCRRFDVRHGSDVRLSRLKYQGIPVGGYAVFMRRMLRDVDVRLGVDYRSCGITPRVMTIYTGPIDEYFGFDLGRLEYRGQQRDHFRFKNVEYHQVVGQINYPQHKHGQHIRILEWKHMLHPSELMRANGTVITIERPYSPIDPNDFEYPVPTAKNDELYKQYRLRAKALEPKVLIIGRLGQYRYFDMDAAIANALRHAEAILGDGEH
jgi:UDP-galactopyranose mutase